MIYQTEPLISSNLQIQSQNMVGRKG